jgi:hypothetical protein
LSSQRSGVIELNTEDENKPVSKSSFLSPPSFLLAIALFAFCLGLYCVVRYSGLWLTADLTQLVSAGNSTVTNQKINFTLAGFGDALLIKFLADFTGIAPLTFAQTVLPLLLIAIAITLLHFYQTISPRIALIATLLMLVQPIFVANAVNSALLFGWILTIVFTTEGTRTQERSYELRVTSYELPNSIKSVFVLVVLFLALLAFERYMAGLVLVLCGLGVAITKLKSLFVKSESFKISYYWYLLISCALIWSVSLFIFPLPFNFSGNFLPDSKGWLNFLTYLTLNAISILILLLGLAQWLRQSNKAVGLSWGMFGASWLLLISVPFLPERYTGMVWSLLLLVAVPLAVELVMAIKLQGFATAVLNLFLLGAAVSTVLVVTRDPLVSEQWQYISKSEQLAYEWSEQFMEGEKIWTDYAGQLAAYTTLAQEKNRNIYQNSDKPLTVLLMSQKIQVWANRLLLALPETVDKNRVYDNGKAWIYR